jgi:hypothetical protein
LKSISGPVDLLAESCYEILRRACQAGRLSCGGLLPRSETIHPRGATSMQRSHSYRRLLLSCIALTVCFGLPMPWSRLVSFGYLVLGIFLIQGLGPKPRLFATEGAPSRRYRLLGIAAIAFWLLWTLTPVEMGNTGIPVILLWTIFAGCISDPGTGQRFIVVRPGSHLAGQLPGHWHWRRRSWPGSLGMGLKLCGVELIYLR